MSVRLRYKIECAISSTSSEERDLGNVKVEVVSDAQGEGGTRKFNLAGGDTDIPICLGNVSNAKFLFIRTLPANQNDPCSEVRIRLNNILGEQLLISPVAPSKEGYLLITATGVTAVYASNMGTTAMALTVSVAGD